MKEIQSTDDRSHQLKDGTYQKNSNDFTKCFLTDLNKNYLELFHGIRTTKRHKYISSINRLLHKMILENLLRL